MLDQIGSADVISMSSSPQDGARMEFYSKSDVNAAESKKTCVPALAHSWFSVYFCDSEATIRFDGHRLGQELRRLWVLFLRRNQMTVERSSLTCSHGKVRRVWRSFGTGNELRSKTCTSWSWKMVLWFCAVHPLCLKARSYRRNSDETVMKQVESAWNMTPLTLVKWWWNRLNQRDETAMKHVELGRISNETICSVVIKHREICESGWNISLRGIETPSMRMKQCVSWSWTTLLNGNDTPWICFTLFNCFVACCFKVFQGVSLP